MFNSYSFVILTVSMFASPAFAGSIADETQDEMTPRIARENRNHIGGIENRVVLIEDRIDQLERKPTNTVKEPYGSVIVTPITSPIREELEEFKLTCINLNTENEVDALASRPLVGVPDPFVCESQLRDLENDVNALFAREQGATMFVGVCLDFIPVPFMTPSPCSVAGMGHWAEGMYSGYTVDLFAKVGPNPFSLGGGITTAIYRRTHSGLWAHGVSFGGEIYDIGVVGSYRQHRTVTGTVGFYNRGTFSQGPKGYWDGEFSLGLKGGMHNVSPGVYGTEIGQNGWILVPSLEVRIRRRFKNRDDDPSKDPRY